MRKNPKDKSAESDPDRKPAADGADGDKRSSNRRLGLWDGRYPSSTQAQFDAVNEEIARLFGIASSEG
jgi:hypothetical protein